MEKQTENSHRTVIFIGSKNVFPYWKKSISHIMISLFLTENKFNWVTLQGV